MFEGILTLSSVLVPPLFDFVKKKFLKPNQDSPEATLSTLATTKPDIMPAFIEAQAKLLKAQTEYFNRDVIGTPSLWVINMRASIRPLFVCVSVPARICSWIFSWHIDPQFCYLMDVCIGSWFGSRLI